jgi:hypothetical protein
MSDDRLFLQPYVGQELELTGFLFGHAHRGDSGRNPAPISLLTQVVVGLPDGTSESIDHLFLQHANALHAYRAVAGCGCVPLSALIVAKTAQRVIRSPIRTRLPCCPSRRYSGRPNKKEYPSERTIRPASHRPIR